MEDAPKKKKNSKAPKNNPQIGEREEDMSASRTKSKKRDLKKKREHVEKNVDKMMEEEKARYDRHKEKTKQTARDKANLKKQLESAKKEAGEKPTKTERRKSQSDRKDVTQENNGVRKRKKKDHDAEAPTQRDTIENSSDRQSSKNRHIQGGQIEFENKKMKYESATPEPPQSPSEKPPEEDENRRTSAAAVSKNGDRGAGKVPSQSQEDTQRHTEQDTERPANVDFRKSSWNSIRITVYSLL